MLYEALAPSAPLTDLHLRASRPDGEAVDVRVPIKALNDRDTTIHKFAPSSAIWSAVRAPGRIHLQHNAPGRAVRAAGKRLGCKWDLTSKWTSFHAVEERLREDTTQEPFIDGLHPGIEVVGRSDFGL